jgi:hypothetical protein
VIIGEANGLKVAVELGAVPLEAVVGDFIALSLELLRELLIAAESAVNHLVLEFGPYLWG